MSKTHRNKHNFSKLHLLVLVVFFSNFVKAQPGWQDFTARYFYTILDEKGNEISFMEDKNYSIIIDSMLYKTPNIPQEFLKKAIQSNNLYGNQIQINDFSIAIPQKNSTNSKKRLEIKIVYKKDTMYICQSSGIGSFSNDINFFQDKPIKRTPDFTLQFIKGHYYFPSWAIGILKNLPQTDKNVKIVNVSQSHFIVPKKEYDLVYNNKYNKEQGTEIDDLVLNNFMKGYFSINKRNEFTKFDKSALPYQSPNWSGVLSVSKDSNIFFGMMQYSMDYKNCSSGTRIFSILNKKQNTIKQFFPKENTRLFCSEYLYADTFNTMLYLPVRIKEEFDFKLSDCQSNLLSERNIYSSENEGKTWQENIELKELFTKYNFSKFEFLDKNYALAYSRRELKDKVKKIKTVQGTYYLLKNFQVVDSLKTPDDIYYNSNYNKYRFSVKNDTILLGSWSYDKHNSIGTIYFQPYLKKVNENWKFQISEKIYSHPTQKKSTDKEIIREYQNFKLINNRTLVFNNGAGSLTLNLDVSNNISHSGYIILEKESQIYLINGSKYGSVYVSFDKGSTWYLYPIALEQKARLRNLWINEQNEVSYFSNVKIKGEGYKMKTVYRKFSKE